MLIVYNNKDIEVLSNLLSFDGGGIASKIPISAIVEEVSTNLLELEIVGDGQWITPKLQIFSEHPYNIYFSVSKNLKTGYDDECVINLDIKPDKRFNYYEYGKPEYYKPPDFFQGYVYVNLNCKYIMVGTEFIVSHTAIIFHELSELYYRLFDELEYIEAHNKALKDEIAWREYLLKNEPEKHIKLGMGVAGETLRRL